MSSVVKVRPLYWSVRPGRTPKCLADHGPHLTFEGRDIGDQRVSVVLKEQPLRRVQLLLADTLDLYWRRDRQAPDYRYVLFQDLRSRKQEQELLSLSGEQFEAGIRTLVASAKLTPDEIDRLSGQNPTRAWWLAHPFLRPAIRLLGGLSRAEWQQLIETGQVERPYSSLSPDHQQLVRQYVEETNKSRAGREEQQGTPGKHRLGDVTQPGGKVRFRVFGGVPPGTDSSVDFTIETRDGHGGGSGFGTAYTDEQRQRLRQERMLPSFQKDGPPGQPKDDTGDATATSEQDKPGASETARSPPSAVTSLCIMWPPCCTARRPPSSCRLTPDWLSDRVSCVVPGCRETPQALRAVFASETARPRR